MYSLYDILFILFQSSFLIILGLFVYLLSSRLIIKYAKKDLLKKLQLLLGLYFIGISFLTGLQIYTHSTDCYKTAINSSEVKALVEANLGGDIENYYQGFGKALYNPAKIKASGEVSEGIAFFPLTICNNNGNISVYIYLSQDSSFIWKVDSARLK